MERVLVTGAAGFIGQALVEKLLCENKKIIALVLPEEAGRLKKQENLAFVEGNLDDADDIRSKLQNEKFDTIYHLAWVGVSTTYKNDRKLQMKNIEYAMFMMELAKEHGCQKIICTGSVSEYAYEDGAVDGTRAVSPADMYSATKAAVHIYCDLYARQNELDFNWVLIPSIYGPGRTDNNLITYAIQMLSAGKKPSFTKLEQKWDYIYIDDLILSLYLVGEKGRKNQVYVTGSGVSRPMCEYVEILKDQIDPDAELGIGDLPYKTNRIDNSVVDITKLQSDTGYKPQVSFEEGIRNTIDFFREQEDRNK